MEKLHKYRRFIQFFCSLNDFLRGCDIYGQNEGQTSSYMSFGHLHEFSEIFSPTNKRGGRIMKIGGVILIVGSGYSGVPRHRTPAGPWIQQYD